MAYMAYYGSFLRCALGWAAVKCFLHIARVHLVLAFGPSLAAADTHITVLAPNDQLEVAVSSGFKCYNDEEVVVVRCNI